MSDLDPSRLAALDALLSIWNQSGILEENRFADLEPKFRARAFRLTRETIRQEAGFDFIIKKFASKKPAIPVRAILHLSLYELLVDKAAPHGVLHEWVEIAKSHENTARAAGFINANLRRVSEANPKLNPTNQFGKPLRAHLMGQYGASILDQINKVQSVFPPTDIRLRKGLDMDEWASKLGGEALTGTHSIRLASAAQISQLEGFDDGQWWVQDVAASVPVDCFDNIAGKDVLDLCAAPGGKTMQLADLGANVTAVEISKMRAKRIAQNLERMKLKANIVIQDALEFREGRYDAILLDAPCSATGTIRRHPDLRFDAPLERMKSLTPIQAQLLQNAWSLLKPGGELVYAVCSLLKEEGEMQIETFMQNNSDAKSLEMTNPFRKESAGFIRIIPSDLAALGGCDGFFIAKLKKAD